MAKTTIGALPAAASLADTDQVEVESPGAGPGRSKRATVAQISAKVAADLQPTFDTKQDAFDAIDGGYY